MKVKRRSQVSGQPLKPSGPKRKTSRGRSRGRPSKYTEKLAENFCAELAEGKSVRRVCAQENMPSASSVFVWLKEKPGFLEQYARAKEESADAMFEEILDIADDGRNDWMEKFDKEGNSIGWQANGENIQRSKLRIDARKWMMAKMKPKKYGDRTILGGDEENPLNVRTITHDMTPEECAQVYQDMLRAGKAK